MKKHTIFCLIILCTIGTAFSQGLSRADNTISLTARGWGKNRAETKLDAIKRGVETVVLDMLTTTEEKQNFREKGKLILEDANKYIFDYKIKRTIKEKGKLREKKYNWTMTLKLKIKIGELRKDLEFNGIILSSKELMKKLYNFKIMPYVDEKKSSPGFVSKKDIVYAKIGAYFQNHHIPFIGEEEIRKSESNEEIIALDKSFSANLGEEDLLLQLARNTRADFYIKIVGHIDETQFEGIAGVKTSISITIYTVMTAENIASQTGYSPSYSLSSRALSVSAGIEKAISSSMHDIINKMRLFWKDYAKGGRPYQVILYDYSLGEFARIRRVLKEMVTQIRLDKKVGNVTSFTVWYKKPLEELLFELPARVELNQKEDPIIIGNTVRFFRKEEHQEGL
ncbi:MAG: hypothetical protein GY757_49265 [bacterium]|nr:hypothetical protein [bacterium]